MGNYNCKECLDRDNSVINEMLLNANSSDQENLRNTRSDRLKVLKSNNVENEIINLEENNQLSKNSSQLQKSKLKNKKNSSHKILRKEERDNNILLKNELNKIKQMNNSVNNLNQKKLTNNDNADDISELIESQRKQIIAQEKIIEEYKNKQSILEEQRKQLELTRKKIIDEQLSLLNEQKIKNKKTNQVFKNKNNSNKQNFPEIKTSPTDMNMINNSNSKQKIIVSKSTPKLKIKTAVKNINNEINDNINNININNMNFPNIKKFERTQVIRPNFLNLKKLIKENETSPEKMEENNETQIEENDNYERVEDNEEDEDNKLFRYSYPQSKRFKIETYEPTEPGNKIENEEGLNDINDLFENKDIFLEPRDSTKLSLRKAVIPKPNYSEKNKNKELFDKKKKKETGPRDSRQNTGININFRGTFENENLNNLNIVNSNKKSAKKKDINKVMNIKQIGPRDSRRKGEYEFNYNLTEPNNNEKNDIPFIISNEHIIGQNFNNRNNNNININNNDNEEINEVLIQQQEQFNDANNIFQTNNIYFSNEYNFNSNQESPKFNSKYNEDITKTDRNSETYGPYLNQYNDINTVIPTIPFIYNDNQEQEMSQTLNDIYRPNLNNIDAGLNNFGIVENNNMDNPLMYSVDKINTNFF